MSEGYVLSRRERKKMNCKYSILRAAKELIMTQGVDVSIESIADAADISYPTFFNYFPTKAGLFYAIYLEEIEDLQEFAQYELKDEVSAKKQIERLFSTLMHDFFRYRYLDLYIAGEVAKRTAESGGDEEISKMFERSIQNGIETGEFKPDLDARNCARLIAGIVLSSSFFNGGEENCLAMLSILLSGMIQQKI